MTNEMRGRAGGAPREPGRRVGQAGAGGMGFALEPTGDYNREAMDGRTPNRGG